MFIRFAQSARKHKIGRSSARFLMGAYTPTEGVREGGQVELTWRGEDERGRMLTVIAVVKPDRNTGEPMLLVIHVMPDYGNKE